MGADRRKHRKLSIGRGWGPGARARGPGATKGSDFRGQNGPITLVKGLPRSLPRSRAALRVDLVPPDSKTLKSKKTDYTEKSGLGAQIIDWKGLGARDRKRERFSSPKWADYIREGPYARLSEAFRAEKSGLGAQSVSNLFQILFQNWKSGL